VKTHRDGVHKKNKIGAGYRGEDLWLPERIRALCCLLLLADSLPGSLYQGEVKWVVGGGMKGDSAKEMKDGPIGYITS